jgi:hypothetical protein
VILAKFLQLREIGLDNVQIIRSLWGCLWGLNNWSRRRGPQLRIRNIRRSFYFRGSFIFRFRKILLFVSDVENGSVDETENDFQCFELASGHSFWLVSDDMSVVRLVKDRIVVMIAVRVLRSSLLLICIFGHLFSLLDNLLAGDQQKDAQVVLAQAACSLSEETL